jgi:hypothetical protein
MRIHRDGSLAHAIGESHWLFGVDVMGFTSQTRTSQWLERIKHKNRDEAGELKGIFVSIVINTKAKSRNPRPWTLVLSFLELILYPLSFIL